MNVMDIAQELYKAGCGASSLMVEGRYASVSDADKSLLGSRISFQGTRISIPEAFANEELEEEFKRRIILIMQGKALYSEDKWIVCDSCQNDFPYACHPLKVIYRAPNTVFEHFSESNTVAYTGIYQEDGVLVARSQHPIGPDSHVPEWAEKIHSKAHLLKSPRNKKYWHEVKFHEPADPEQLYIGENLCVHADKGIAFIQSPSHEWLDMSLETLTKLPWDHMPELKEELNMYMSLKQA